MHLTVRALAAAATTGAVALLSLGCGSSGHASGAAGDTVGTRATATTAAGSAALNRATSAQLQAGLLPAAEVSVVLPGATVTERTENVLAPSSTGGICNGPDSTARAGTVPAEAGAAFQAASGPWPTEVVLRFPDAAHAAAFVAGSRQAAGCHSYVASTGSSTPSTSGAVQVTVPRPSPVGDLTVLESALPPLPTSTLSIAFVQLGDVVVITQLGEDKSQQGLADLRTLSAHEVDRLRSAVGASGSTTSS